MTRVAGVVRMRRWVWRVVVASGVCVLLALVWVAAGGPIFVDRWLNVTQSPATSAAIIVLAGGTNGRNLPLPQGWDRLQAATNLLTDQWAPVVVFSGGGTSRVPEAEIYANAAAWLGMPREAMVFETAAQSTADHGRALLGVALPGGSVIARDTPLLVVTSAFHSRRARMSFEAAGYTQVRFVSAYTPRGSATPGTPRALTTTVPTHRPSGKQYDDVLFRMAYRSFDLFIGLREVGAIMVEKWRS